VFLFWQWTGILQQLLVKKPITGTNSLFLGLHLYHMPDKSGIDDHYRSKGSQYQHLFLNRRLKSEKFEVKVLVVQKNQLLLPVLKTFSLSSDVNAETLSISFLASVSRHFSL